jgi:hypothetical protein
MSDRDRIALQADAEQRVTELRADCGLTEMTLS